MTHKSGGQIKIEYESDIQKSKDRIFDYFKQADFTDCKINAFPFYTKHTRIDLEVKNKTSANFIMIDLDLGDFRDNNKEMLDKQLNKTLYKLSLKLNEEAHPTVLWTGNGYHIYQPIEGIVFEKEKIFYDFLPYVDNNRDLTTEFLRFAEKFFTNGKSDPKHLPSIKSCLVRVPGTINPKNDGNMVKIIQRWNGKRPAIQWINHDFRDHLIQKRIDRIKEKEKEKKVSYSNKSHSQNHKIEWIENLLQTPIEDYRKQCLWRILCPYLINIKKLTKGDASFLLKEWLQKCDGLRKLDFNSQVYLNTSLRNVKKYLPPSKEKLKNKYTELYHLLRTKNIISI